MTKTMIAIAAAVVAGAALAAPTDAFAQRRAGAVAAGVVGGLAAGAILGGALAGGPVYAAPAPVYVAPPPPVYYSDPAPVYVAPRCYWARGEPEWDGYRWVRPRVRVCQ